MFTGQRDEKEPEKETVKDQALGQVEHQECGMPRRKMYCKEEEETN